MLLRNSIDKYLKKYISNKKFQEITNLYCKSRTLVHTAVQPYLLNFRGKLQKQLLNHLSTLCKGLWLFPPLMWFLKVSAPLSLLNVIHYYWEEAGKTGSYMGSVYLGELGEMPCYF